MAQKQVEKQPRRAFIQIPPNWATMTDAEKKAARLEMARSLQRQLLPSDQERPKAD